VQVHGSRGAVPLDPNDLANLLDRRFKIVVHNDIVEFAGRTELTSRRRETPPYFPDSSVPRAVNRM